MSFLNFEGGPGVPLLKFRSFLVSLLNSERSLESQVPVPAFTPCTWKTENHFDESNSQMLLQYFDRLHQRSNSTANNNNKI